MALSLTYNPEFLEDVHAALTQRNVKITGRPGIDIRHAAQLAVEEKIEPKPLHLDGKERCSCRISASHIWYIELEKATPELSSAQRILFSANGLIAASRKEAPIREDIADNHSILPLPGFEPREQQQELAAFLTQGHAYKNFRLCEASTGIGKGMALVAAAIQTRRNYPDKQVVVTAPSLAILDQLVMEYDRIAGAYNLTDKMVRATSTLDYLSETLAYYWCDENPNHPQQAAFKEKLDKNFFDISYYEDFDDIPLQELSVFHCLSRKKDKGYEEYLLYKKNILEADIVFCSHSMLVLHITQIRRDTAVASLDWQDYVRQRDSVFKIEQKRPEYYKLDNQTRVASIEPSLRSGFFAPEPFVFIDEAHLFKSSIQMCLRNNVPLHSLSVALEKYIKMKGKGINGKRAKSVLEAVNKLVDMTMSTINGTKEISIRGDNAHKGLLSLEQNLHEAFKAFAVKNTLKDMQKTSIGRQILRFTRSLNNIKDDKYGTFITASPIRKYISLVSTNPDTRVINDLLTRTVSGISYTSATLHVPSASERLGGYKSIITQLQCPEKHVEVHAPIESDWLKDNVQAFVAPRSAMFNPSADNFLEYVSEALYSQIKDVKGGSLILCTSYEQIEHLSEDLADNGCQDRLIVQQQGATIKNLQKRYMAMYRNGLRPIWLATGAAWTGLDISDHEAPAQDDLAIEYLGIIKLPFSNGGSDHRSIEENIMNTTFMLKQGVGRLIRRPNRPKTQICLFDGRIHQKSKGIYWAMHHYYVNGYSAEEF